MERFKRPTLILIAVLFLLSAVACSKAPLTGRTASTTIENPFEYSFVKEFHLSQRVEKNYSSYKAFYLLTEDFEPSVQTVSELESIRDVLKFASELSSKYGVPWTHFVDANALAPAYVSGDNAVKERCRSMIADLKTMIEAGDDAELHLHGGLNSELLEYLRKEEKLHVKTPGLEDATPYRQRKSFFFNSFYRHGYREMVASLAYAKRLLEKALYNGQKQELAFRPGGWDHGSTKQDTMLYFYALSDAGLIANSGLATGDFGGENFRVGNDPGHNLATVLTGKQRIIEVSPTAGPGGYINPVLPHDLRKLSSSTQGEMPVIVAVYHLSSLQNQKGEQDSPAKSGAQLQAERVTLENHFKTVAELAAAKIIYPITLRGLLEIISEMQDAEASAQRQQSGG